MLLVALDTMTMIWGFRSQGAKPGNPKQADLAQMQFRAEVLIEILQEDKARIVVPTVVADELLRGVELESHGDFISKLQLHFFCPPYDMHAVGIAAKLHIEHNSYPTQDQYLNRTKILAADTRIIATAHAAGARRIYSHDAKFRKLASSLSGMAALDLPDRHPDVFRDAELRKRHRLPLLSDS